MELKEAIAELKDLVSGIRLCTPDHKTALKTAISHLETLQKVQEMGGVKRREERYIDSPDAIEYNNKSYCETKGFNEALDLKDAELTRKLEGLEKLLDTLLTPYMRDSERIAIKQAIQELFLGKKEE